MSIRLRTLALALLLLSVLGLAGGALFVWLGMYDPAATEQHTRPVYHLLDYAMRRSVKAHARDLAAPADLADAARVQSGAAHYRAHCVQCHGARGVPPDPLALGLTPAPANLVPVGRHWPAREIFQVVKYGIKMTGMPAWIYQLTDDEIWSVVAFVQAMPALTTPDYAALVQALPAGQAHAPAPPAGPGRAEAGRRAVQQYLCATCHTIPGIVSADRHVGPPLDGMARRAFIGGVLPNTPENMVRWLLDPQQVDPLSAMPPLGLSEQDARDIAAFLATLDSPKAR